MTDTVEDPDRRKMLVGAAALGASAATSGCVDDVKGILGMDNGDNDPEGGGSTPNTPVETPTSTPEPPENTFRELDEQIEKIETDANLEQNIGANFDYESLDLHKQMLEERQIEDVENWGLYASIDVTDFRNWDDLDGIYNSSEEGREQLGNMLSWTAWDIFQTMNQYAGDLINRDDINLDSVTEVGVIFEDDEGETAGYIAGQEDLDEIYSADSLEDSYVMHFRNNFELYPLDDRDFGETDS